MGHSAAVKRGNALSIALAALGLLGLLIAIIASNRPGAAMISTQQQDRVRGLDPNHSQVRSTYCSTCTVCNVITWNLSQPTVAVDGTGACTAATQVCITCVIAFNWNYNSNPGNPGILFKNPMAVDCGADSGGNIGPCIFDGTRFICTVDSAYDCYTFAISYGQQGGGG